MMHPCTAAHQPEAQARDPRAGSPRLRFGLVLQKANQSLPFLAQAGVPGQGEPRAVLHGYAGYADFSDASHESSHPQRKPCLGAAAPRQVRLQSGVPTGLLVMASAAESWYVRLPDGRTLRARNADILRGYLSTGRIPSESTVRRSGEEEWRPLERVAELAAALPSRQVRVPEPVAGRPQAATNELRTLGVRGLVEEL